MYIAERLGLDFSSLGAWTPRQASAVYNELRLNQAENDWVDHNAKDKSRTAYREKLEKQMGVKFTEAQRAAIHGFLFSKKPEEIHGPA